MMVASDSWLGQCIADERQIIVEVSDEFAEIVGLERSELVGRHALSFTLSADLSRNAPMLKSLARSGPAFAITKRYVRGDGRIVWVQNQVSAQRDSAGRRYICATSHLAGNGVRSGLLTRRYEAVRSLCALITTGRAALGPDIVSLPAAETLLLLYKAEIEGVSLTIDDLADRTDMSTGVILRWMKHLLERELIQIEGDTALTVRTAVRISRICELALDALLTDRNP
jgi:PAS domain S-box-containing protein